MLIPFKNKAFEFRPWKSHFGRVFDRTFAFACGTTAIDDERHWETPDYVLGAAFDGVQGYFIQRGDLAAFFEAHRSLTMAFHDAALALAVIHRVAGDMDVYRQVDDDLVLDTQLMHRLRVLGEEGHTADGEGESSLGHCAKVYLDTELSANGQDSTAEDVRLCWDKWLKRQPAEIDEVYLEQLAREVVATRLVGLKVFWRLMRLLDGSHTSWGFGSPEWLDECVERFGLQTHHIQLRAAIVLRAVTANGLHVDTKRCDRLTASLERLLRKQRRKLLPYGFLTNDGGENRDALQDVLRRQQAEHPQCVFPRTKAGLFSTASEALRDVAPFVPFVRLLLVYHKTKNLLNSFLGKMRKPVLHPSFDVLVRSGRTSSSGEINAQNLPAQDNIRSCFVPSPGHVLLDADYKTVESVTLSQACMGQFGLKSRMAEAINEGKDLHRLVTAHVLGKEEEEVTDAERDKAKPINFGLPGGMGPDRLVDYARGNYGIALTREEAEDFTEVWFGLFPEMREFLGGTASDVARLFELTPASHRAFTDDARFLKHSNNDGRTLAPNPILGAMCLKVLAAPNANTRDGKPYSAKDVAYFWSQVEAKVSLLPTKFQKAVRERRPSAALLRAVLEVIEVAGVFTFSGRLRANANYCSRRNTVFQGLAADGAKLALWLLWRAGYRIVNFIHDEVLIEVPADSDLKQHAERIRDLMVEGMKAVVPDILVKVKYAAAERWYKGAKAVFDESGTQLLLWNP